jgi:hypothetical protein
MPPAPAPPPYPWYASGTFWAIAGVVVAIIFGTGAIVAAYRSQNPRRRLNVYVSSSTPLVHEKGKLLALEVRSDGEVLKNPHLVTVVIVVRGRRDIRKDAFDGPIELMFGARIVGVLEANSATKVPGTPVPEFGNFRNALKIEPALLRRDHKLTFTVLVEGQHSPKFKAVVPIEADVRMESPLQPELRTARYVLAAAVAALFGTFSNIVLSGASGTVLGMGPVLAVAAASLVGATIGTWRRR